MNKIVIFGAGSVGSTYAYALMLNSSAHEIVLIDQNMERALGEAMDLQHGLAFTRPVLIRTGDYTDFSDADIAVITAGAKRNPGESRMELAGRNAKIISAIIPDIVKSGFHGILLIISNPVDVLTHLSWKLSGFPRNRVLGSGTVLDSTRLRSLLSMHCGVDARNIHAIIIGEHGDSEFALWSSATIGGMPISRYCDTCRKCAPEERYPGFLKQVKQAAADVISKKGSTFYAIALALVQITDAILRDEHRVLPVSSVIENLYGINAIALSVPCIIGRNGIERILEFELNPEEKTNLKISADAIKETIEKIKHE